METEVGRHGYNTLVVFSKIYILLDIITLLL